MNKFTLTAVAGVTFAAGVVATRLWTARSEQPPTAMTGATAPAGAAASPASGIVRLDPELARRAGIAIETVQTSTVAASIRVPGTVLPNAYRQVSVTPLVGGRVTRMLVELGQRVMRGTPIAEVYSPDVADARARYLTVIADVDTGETKLRRTERLAALGSVSQQELEQVRAEHVRHESEVRQAEARLRLLGIDPAGVNDAAASILSVTAPQAGVVVQRPATPGMTAEPSTVLATIAELSPVWVIADVYELDLGRVAKDASVTITAEAYPGAEFRGRVTYLSPEVRPETRTAQVRIELPNPDGKLRFGMFVNALIEERAGPALAVPRSAVQMIGPDSIVFVAEDASGTVFQERRVVVGPAEEERIAVFEGLTAGERVVTSGSFVVRAEAERLAIHPAPPDGAGRRGQNLQTASVAITTRGFEPGSLTLKAGVPARVTFTRTTDETCATALAMPDYGITRALPLNQPVIVEFTPTKDAEFQCGMGMLAGKLVVR